MPEFDNEDEARNYVNNRLQSVLSDQRELREQIIPGIWYFLDTEASRSLLIKRLNWVIQDEELELVQVLCRGCEAAIGVGFLAFSANSDMSTTLASVSGMMTAMIDLVIRIRRKGAVITKESAIILALLRTSRIPLSPERIVSALNVKDQLSLDRHQVEEVLKSLRNVRLGDGNLVPLVENDEENRWWTVGI